MTENVSDSSGWAHYGVGMRLAVVIMALLAFALGSPAFAKSDKTPPGQSASQGDKTSAPESPGNAHDADHGKSGTGEEAERAPKPDKTQRAAATPLDQDEALRAVEEHEALPLVRIVVIAQAQGTGRVVNVRLVRVQGVLMYQLTLLDDTGRSRRDYYYARSGYPVDLN